LDKKKVFIYCFELRAKERERKKEMMNESIISLMLNKNVLKNEKHLNIWFTLEEEVLIFDNFGFRAEFTSFKVSKVYLCLHELRANNC
jgi:hypothetical protein